jgi:RNA polymerase primary sigma factor
MDAIAVRTIPEESHSIRMYLRQIGRVPLLTAAEEVALCRAIEAAPTELEAQALRQALAEANLRLVVSVARRYRCEGMPLLDLSQEGTVGLLKAVDRFDYRRGFRFSTYAVWWIRQAISRAVTQRGRLVRTPAPIVALEDEPGVTGVLTAAGADGRTPEDQAVSADLQATLLAQLSSLDRRERQILECHYGIGGRREQTFDEIAGRFGITAGHTRRLAARAMTRLRKRMLAVSRVSRRAA